MEFKNKKVLIFGLGSLGGGVATAKWFFKKGAKLRITDLKRKKDLAKSLEKLKNIKARFILEKHRYEDINWAEIIAVNPGVSYKNDFILYAKKKGKEVLNDYCLFFQQAKGDFLAVTGTRGKTTTTFWIYTFLKLFGKKLRKKILIGGNQPEKSLLKILDKTKDNTISVLEISSFQLEFNNKFLKAPNIAIITNIMIDHLNRYENLEEYAKVKANIFLNQTNNNFLILNRDNDWWKFFLKLKPQSKVYFVSKKSLKGKGIFCKKNFLFIKENKLIKLFNVRNFIKIYGEHNLYNLMFSILATYIYLKNFSNFNIQKFFEKIKKIVFNLPLPPFRQEIIFKKKNLIIVNDSAATTPDATILAILRFKKFFGRGTRILLICGGTDKNLDFSKLSKIINQNIPSSNLILLNGSATQKLIKELEKINYPIKNIFENLKECVKKAFELVKNKSIILFSPGSASFEKFKNEFDRGKKFNKIVKSFL